MGGIAGNAGGNGKAVLIFTIASESKVKEGGQWYSLDSINYKVSGIWKKVTAGYFKVGGVWKNIFTTDILFLGNSIGFGNVSGGTTSGTEGTGGIPTPASIPPQDSEGGGGFIPPRGKPSYKCRQNDFIISPEENEPNSGKGVVCTMMNQTAGFGTFRNKIWHKFWLERGSNGKKSFTQNHRMEKGYHAIFVPLVRFAKKDGTLNLMVRAILSHMGRRVTADFYGEMRNKKRDNLGRLYRTIFEPVCWGIGKFRKERTNLHRLGQPINNHKENK